MTTDLDAVLLGAQMVGVVDHPMGQPQQSLLHRSQMIDWIFRQAILLPHVRPCLVVDCEINMDVIAVRIAQMKLNEPNAFQFKALIVMLAFV